MPVTGKPRKRRASKTPAKQQPWLKQVELFETDGQMPGFIGVQTITPGGMDGTICSFSYYVSWEAAQRALCDENRDDPAGLATYSMFVASEPYHVHDIAGATKMVSVYEVNLWGALIHSARPVAVFSWPFGMKRMVDIAVTASDEQREDNRELGGWHTMIELEREQVILELGEE